LLRELRVPIGLWEVVLLFFSFRVLDLLLLWLLLGFRDALLEVLFDFTVLILTDLAFMALKLISFFTLFVLMSWMIPRPLVILSLFYISSKA